MEAEQLVDLYEIQRLKARYCQCVDTKSWSELRTLVTEDLAVFKDTTPEPSSTSPVSTGADEFVASVARVAEDRVTVHHGHNPDISFIDDRHATGIWAMFDWIEDPSRNVVRVGYGHYHEEYEKGEDGKWRIRVLRLTRLRLGALRHTPDGGDPLEDWVR